MQKVASNVSISVKSSLMIKKKGGEREVFEMFMCFTKYRYIQIQVIEKSREREREREKRK